VLHAATILSYPIEPIVAFTGPASIAHHAGFVFIAS